MTGTANEGSQKGNRENFLKTKLDALVAAGTISQAEETAALNLLVSSSTNSKTGNENFLKNKLIP
ncbi:hypothetical protein [Clostridium sp.]|jgi:hypothetical protein|uniref:hypothetical protein n=1 Tax=Clostridium sp. TaxID=1506 RepID=UPI002FDE33A4